MDANWIARACLVDGSTPQYEADIYFNPTPTQTWFPNVTNQASPIYFGFEYIPIRGILVKNKAPYLKSQKFCNVICVAGGSDPSQLADSFQKALMQIECDFEATIFTDRKLESCEKIKVRPIGSSFQTALDGADVVLTAAGSTVWELIARRIPFGVACAARNQMENYTYLTENLIGVPLGIHTQEFGWKLNLESIKALISDGVLRTDLWRKSDSLNFGHGANAIALELVKVLNRA